MSKEGLYQRHSQGLENCEWIVESARLVGGDDALLDAKLLVQRVEGHEGDGGGTVRIGDELLALARVHVDLWDHQWYVRIHSPRRRIVDHDGTGL